MKAMKAMKKKPASKTKTTTKTKAAPKAKPAKTARACQCGTVCHGQPDPSQAVPTARSILYENLKDCLISLNKLNDAAVKAAEVTKTLLEMTSKFENGAASLREAISGISDGELKAIGPVRCPTGEVANTIDGILEEEFAKAERKRVENAPKKTYADILNEKARNAEKMMFQEILKLSRFAFTADDKIEFRRRNDLDNGGEPVFEVRLRQEQVDLASRSVTYAASESFTMRIHDDAQATVDEFDRNIASLHAFAIPLKGNAAKTAKSSTNSSDPATAVKVDKKGKAAKAAGKGKKAKDASSGKCRAWPEDSFVRGAIVKNSKYYINPGQLEISHSHYDKKHSSFVFKVFVYPKSLKRLAKNETVGCDWVHVKVKAAGDRPDLIAARFDRFVQDFRHSKLPLRRKAK